MTHSPTPQAVHCPLPRPPHPLLPPPPFPSLPTTPTTAGIVGCRQCCSARSSSSSSPSPSPSSHRRHYPHHHHHCVHLHRHRSLTLPRCRHRGPRHSFSRDVSPNRAGTSDGAGSSEDKSQERPTSQRHLHCTDCSRGRRQHIDSASHPIHTPHPRPLTSAVAVAAASKTWQWCRTALLTFPDLLLLPHRRKSLRSQLSQVPRLLLTLCLVLTMLTGRCLASSWIEENANSVKLRAKICQPVPEEHLQSMLGPAYDPSRMSSQDPRAAGKRSDPGSAPEMEEAAFDSYYMEDDPGAGEVVSEDFVDIVTEDGQERDWFHREEVDEEEEGDGSEVQEKDFEEERFYQKKRVGRVDSARQSDRPKSRSRDRQPDRDQRHLYMKRRRRASGAVRDRRSGAAGSDSGFNKDKKNKDSLLPLRLLLSGRNRKLRRKLKKVFRKKAKKLSKRPPPWACNMTKVWGRLKEGYFPRYLLDGRCVTDKCFYRLYDCVPQKYRVKVLKRDPDYCNPLPALGANSTYEQKWSVVRYYVTVGCNCEAADPLQRARSGRRRNS
ncbi:hypothetical protein ACOMHN_034193 [Nucella lapillus]